MALRTFVLCFVLICVGACSKPARRSKEPKVQKKALQIQDAAQELDASTAEPKMVVHLSRDGAFFGRPDYPIRLKLATESIKEVERGYGGRSVAFRITLTNGTRGYFKPEQTFSAAHWFGELAAYYLDRELNLGRTPPAVGRVFVWKRLKQSAPSDERFTEVIVQKDGTVRGSFVWWIPDKLVALSLAEGWEKWLRVRGWPRHAVSPFQRARNYVDQMTGRKNIDPFEQPLGGLSDAGTPASTSPFGRFDDEILEQEPQLEDEVLEKPARWAGDPPTPERPAELSDMILFDYLIGNLDRWGGHNTNVRTRGVGGPLMFFDNAAGFTPGQARNGVLSSRLRVVERFRKRTIDAIANLDVQKWVARMKTDPLAPLVDAQTVRNVEVRRQDILAHVAKMKEKYGEQVFSW